MATIRTVRAQTSWSPYNWSAVGEGNLGDQSDATFWRHTNALSYLSHDLNGTLGTHTAPANMYLERIRACGRARAYGGGTQGAGYPIVIFTGELGYGTEETTWPLTSSWAQKNWAWETAPNPSMAGRTATFAVGPNSDIEQYSKLWDLSEFWLEFDYRSAPSFTVSVSTTTTPGTTETATISAAGLTLDGLPARTWNLSVTGPTNWSTSGSGAYTPKTTPALPVGQYTATLVISSTLRGTTALTTTKTATFRVDPDKPTFTLTATPGRTALIKASSIALSGLPARSWALSITGPQPWATSGSGAWPTGGITTPELVNGSYTVAVTISSTYLGGAWSTTKTVPLTIASGDAFTLLCDTEFESDLAGQFDLACNSIGAVWWCDRSGVVQFALAPPADAAWSFTDDPEAVGVKYVELGVAYDSKNLVNTLAATNKPIPDEVTYTYSDPTSVAMWGARTDSVDLSVYDVGGALARRTKALVDRFKTLALLPNAVTFLAADYPDAAAGIDLYQRVAVTYRGQTFNALVAGVDHALTANDWRVTVTLMKD